MSLMGRAASSFRQPVKGMIKQSMMAVSSTPLKFLNSSSGNFPGSSTALVPAVENPSGLKSFDANEVVIAFHTWDECWSSTVGGVGDAVATVKAIAGDSLPDMPKGGH